MTVEKLLEYGLGVAVIFGLLAPVLWRLLHETLSSQERIVQTQREIVNTLENHLSAIGRSLAVIEERLRWIAGEVKKDVREALNKSDEGPPSCG